jgi:GDP-D-mannose dehydratase
MRFTILPHKVMLQFHFEEPEYTANSDGLGTLRGFGSHSYFRA